MKYYLYTKEELPDGFEFPPSFIDVISKDNIIDLEPWWFLCEFNESAQQWLSILKSQYPSRQLVPFAKVSYSDDIACFDGSDSSGNPKVFYVHAFASPGWEDRGYVESFDKWLKLAKEESNSYKAEQDEEARS